MATTIDSLDIQITASASSAATKLKDLEDALSKLSQCGSLTDVCTNLTKISKALDTVKLNPIKLLTITQLSRALGKLGQVPSLSGLSTSLAELKKVPKVLDGLSTKKLDAFADKMKKLTKAIAPLATQMTKLAGALGRMPNDFTKLINGLNGVGKAAKGFKFSSSGGIGGSLLGGLGLYRIKQAFAAVTREAIQWDGIQYRFGRAFGEDADEMYEYIQKLNEGLGINVQEFMQYSSLMGSIVKGFGLGQEKTSTIAIGATELAYDIWAANNDMYPTLEEAFNAVRSALTGEIEPIRNAGISLTQASMQEYLDNLGMAEVKVSNLSEASKAQLRYAVMVDSAMKQGTVGTYARETMTAEGAVRTLSQQMATLSQSFGSLFLPVLMQVIPWVSAFIQLITKAVAAVASFFNLPFFEIKWDDAGGGFGGVADSAGAAADAIGGAADKTKELKRYLMGIDELNVLPEQTQASGGGAGGGGGGQMLDLELSTLWGDVAAKTEELTSKIKEQMGEILTIAGAIALVLLSWKLTNAFTQAIDFLKALSVAQTLTLGLSLFIAGFGIEFVGIRDAILQGLDGLNFGDILAGGLLGTAGLAFFGHALGKFIAKAFASSAVAQAITAGGGQISAGLFGAGIGGIIAGLPMFIIGVRDALKNGLNKLNGLLIPLGSTMAGAGIGAIIGSLGGPIGTGVGALIGLAIGAVTDGIIALWTNCEDSLRIAWANTKKSLKQAWDDLTEIYKNYIAPVFTKEFWTATFDTVREAIKQTLGDVKTTVSTKWDDITSWFGTNVAPVLTLDYWAEKISTFVDLGSGIVDNIKSGLSSAWKSLKEWWSGLELPSFKIKKPHLSWTSVAVDGWIADVLAALGLPTSLPSLQVSWYAQGGFPSTGELFVAREAGPELVGRMGNKNVVANNDQIVAGISEGVYAAVVAAMQSVQLGSGQSVNVYLDGRQITSAVEKRQRERGASIITNHAYSY